MDVPSISETRLTRHLIKITLVKTTQVFIFHFLKKLNKYNTLFAHTYGSPFYLLTLMFFKKKT